jgi:titin
VHIDHLYIQVGNPPSNPPDGDPSGMTANAASSSQINLAWTDGSSNESGFLLERSPASSGPWSEIADLAAGSQSYNDIGLSANTGYYYRVCAHNVNGFSGYASANATTDSPPPPPPAPQQPSGLTATGASTSQINLQWNDNGPNEDGFRVERSPNGSTGWSELATLGANATSHQDADLPEDTTFHYRVVAFNVSGEATSVSTSGSTQAAPDLSLTASGYRVKGRHHVTLDWTGSSNVDVYRDGSLVASDVGGDSYVDNIGVKGGASYDHQVCEAGTNTCSNTTTTVF